MIPDLIILVETFLLMVAVPSVLYLTIKEHKSKRMITRLHLDIKDLKNGEDTSIVDYVEPDLSDWLEEDVSI